MRFKGNEVESKTLNEEDWVVITTTVRVRRRTLLSKHTRLLNRIKKIGIEIEAHKTRIAYLIEDRIRVESEAKQIESILESNKEAREACEKAITKP